MGAQHLGCPRGEGPLDEASRTAILRALADERAAEARYEAIEQSLGPVMPFRPIVRAERRHAWALEQLFAMRDESAPASSNASPPAKPATLRDACAVGVASERANIALYDELLRTNLPPDVRCVFEHLQAASRERHLPAFERCAAR